MMKKNSKLVLVLILVGIVFSIAAGISDLIISTRIICNMNVANLYPHIDGDYVVWNSDFGNITIYQISSKSILREITDTNAPSRPPYVSGDYVVWDSSNNVYMHQISTNTTTKLTDRNFYDEHVHIDGDYIVWSGHPGMGEIFLYQISTNTTMLISNTGASNGDPRVNGNHVVFYDSSDGDSEIYLYDIDSGITTQISHNTDLDYSPEIFGNNIVWRSNTNGGDWDIYLYEIDTNTTTQITDNTYRDEKATVGDDYIIWLQNWDEVRFYQISTGTSRLISSTTAQEVAPVIYGDYAIFADNIDHVDTIVLYELSTRTSREITTHTDVENLTFDGNYMAWEDERHDIQLAFLDPYPHEGYYQGESEYVITSGNWVSHYTDQASHFYFHDTSEPGTSASFDFTGRQVALLYTGDTIYGDIEISIDGGAPVILNQYADSIGYKNRWNSPILEENPHNITISHPGGTHAINLDAFIVFVPDVTSPEAVTLTAVPGYNSGEILLSWDSPGDDGNVGPVSDVMVRYSSIPIDSETAWDNATDVAGVPNPYAPGYYQEMIVSGLTPRQQYYFALRGVDEMGNMSPFGNSPMSADPSIQHIADSVIQLTHANGKINTFDIEGNYIVWDSGSPGYDKEVYLLEISTGLVSKLTDNTTADFDPQTSGDFVVWSMGTNTGNNIMLYEISNGNITNLTNNSVSNISPKIDGDHVTWMSKDNGYYDVYRYQISTGTSTKISTETKTKRNLEIDGNYIVWESYGSGVADVYYHQISTSTTTKISANEGQNSYPDISGDYLAWVGNEDIYLHKFSNHLTSQITDNEIVEGAPVINGDNLAWFSASGTNKPEIYLYQISIGTTTQITDNDNWDTYSEISGDYLVWSQDQLANAEIFVYEVSTGNQKQLSYNEVSDKAPIIKGNNIVWVGGNETTNELFMYSIGSTAPGSPYEEDNFNIVYNGTWTNQDAAEASGGSFTSSVEAGASAALNFIGKRVSLLYTSGAVYGDIEIVIDGAAPVLLDQSGASLNYQNRWDSPLLDYDSHTVEFRHPGGGSGINIDALMISSPNDIPPDAIELSAVSGYTTGKATLSWIAPGEDGHFGTAVEYILRYATSDIDSETAWDAASEMSGIPAPQSAGTEEVLYLSGLTPHVVYYFSLRARDNSGNLSPLGNSPAVSDPSTPLTYDTANRLTYNHAEDTYHHSDGDYSVWASAVDGDYEIFLNQISTGFITKLTNNTSNDITPKISGDYIAWRSDVDGDYEVYLYHINTGYVRKLSNNDTRDENIDISGDCVTWENKQENAGNVYFYHISTNVVSRLNNDISDNSRPRTNGNYIIWDKDTDLYLYNIQTNTRQMISYSLNPMYAPQINGDYVIWNPSSSTINLYQISSGTTKSFSGLLNHTGGSINGDYAVWENASGIIVYQISTGTSTQITDDDVRNRDAAVFGEYVVWIKGEYDDYDIYMYRISTGVTTHIASNTVLNNLPPIINQNNIIWGDGRDDAREIYRYSIGLPPEDLIYQDFATEITYTGNWAVVNAPEAFEGTYITTDQADSSASMTFTGVQLSLVYTAGPDQGIVEISIDGGEAVQLDQFNTSLSYQNRWNSAPLSDESHTVTISHPGGAHNINIDALVVSRVLDVSQPSVVNLQAKQGYSSGEVNLNWVAPGDDGSFGTATQYIVRYAATAIDSQSAWDAATDATNEPLPLISGTPQQMTVSGLTPNQTYYFALRTLDDSGNISNLSNSPSAADPSKVPDSTNPLQLTDTVTDESGYSISGDYAVWASHNDGDEDIYLYQISTGLVKQITDNSALDGNCQIRGDYVVWESNVTGNWDIFSYQISTGITSQISDRSDDDYASQVNGSNVVWIGQVGFDTEIFQHNLNTQSPVQISSNSADDFAPQVDGSHVVWYGLEGGDREIYLYDISSGVTTQITNNADADDVYPEIYGNNIVWFGGTEADAEIFLYQINTGTTTQITHNSVQDYYPKTFADSIVYYNKADGDNEIYIYQISTGRTIQISNNEIGDSGQEIRGDYVVWQGYDGGNNEVYQYRISTGVFTQLTNDNSNDWDESPFVDGRHVIWGRKIANGNADVFLYSNPENPVSIIYQDIGAAIQYSGNWTNWQHEDASGGSVHYSNEAGATASLTFTGQQISLLFTRYTTRGQVEIIIDNESPILLDQFGPELTFRNRWLSPVLSEGTHTITLRHPGGNHYIDLDAFIVLEPEFIAPATVELTAETGYNHGEVDLSWTAPGDDGNTGTAIEYILRYADTPIDSLAAWDAATDVNGEPQPQPAGTAERLTLKDLELWKTLYFALRTVDDSNNMSDLSNSPAAEVKSPPIAGIGRYENYADEIMFKGNWIKYYDNNTSDYSAHHSNDRSATAEMTFSGRRVSLIYTKSSINGPVEITIDDGQPVLLQQNSGSTSYQNQWDSPIMPDGIHTVLLRHTGGGHYIDLDAFLVTSPEAIPPAAVTLNASTGYESGQINLDWLAPGDNGNYGVANKYFIRYAYSAIEDEAAWEAAADISGEPAPALPGTQQSVVISGLTPGETYFFALRTLDDAANLSDLSNSPSAIAKVPDPIGGGIYQETDPNIEYIGDWTTWNHTSASGGSTVYTNQPDATATLTFSGYQVSLLFTRYSSRGDIQITIDDGAPVLMNQYGSSLSFQERWDSPVMTEGTHTIILRHPGGSHYIDIDAFIITASPETIPPAAVTLSTSAGNQAGQIELSWNAPGDDGNNGRATEYVLRYADQLIDDETRWNAATDVTGEPAPGPSGSAQSMTLPNLTIGKTYYFALRTLDDVGNLSDLSNSPIGWPNNPNRVNPGMYQENQGMTNFFGDWDYHTNNNASGGAYMSTRQPGATASLSFTGRQVTLVFTRDTDRGSVEIIIDNGNPITLTQLGSNQSFQNRWKSDLLSEGNHRITLRHPGGPDTIGVDALVIASDEVITGSIGSPVNISNTTEAEFDPEVNNGYVVWNAYTGHSSIPDVFLYEIKTGTKTQLTNDSIPDEHPQTNGEYVVWMRGNASDAEVYTYQISTGIMAQITNNNDEEKYPKIDGDYIVWSGYKTACIHQISTGITTEIESDDFVNGVKIFGDYVSWISDGNVLYQISSGVMRAFPGDYIDGDFAVRFAPGDGINLYQLSTGIDIHIPDIPNSGDLSIRGDYVIRSNSTSSDDDIYIYKISSGEITRVSTTTGDNFTPQIDGNFAVWYGGSPTAFNSYDIFLYQTNTATRSQITSNHADNTHPKIDGSNIVWQGRGDGDLDIYLLKLGNSQPDPAVLTASTGSNMGEVDLEWIVPWIDPACQGASTQVRYSTLPINTDYDWLNSATRVNGAPWALEPGAIQSMTVPDLAPGQSYYFSVRLGDNCGGLSDVSNSPFAMAGLPPAVESGIYEEDDANIIYQGEWTAWEHNDASGGSVKFSIDPDASALLAFNGCQVSLLYTSFTTRGNVEISIDGGAPVVLNQYGSNLSFQNRWDSPLLEEGTHYVKLSHPGGSHYIDIDALIVFTPESNPPAAVTLNAVTGANNGEVDLSWNAPGDDGDTGTAVEYILRYADTAIDSEEAWNSALDVIGEPVPQIAGTAEAMTLSGLVPEQTYFFALRTLDESANLSDLSNSPSAEAKPITPVEAGTYEQNDVNIRYTGNWTTWTTASASGGSTRYSNDPAASATLTFSGRQVSLLFTRYTTRGNIEITIDGGTPVLLNQYGAALSFQNRWDSSLMDAGTHTIVLRHPGGTKYIDLDALIVSSPESDPPATVTLNAVTGSSTSEIDLSWVAPGDDGIVGTAASYIVRYAAAAIDSQAKWDAATDATGEPTPLVANTSQAMIISGLNPGQTYFFALRTLDDSGNLSDLSNSPSAEAKAPTPVEPGTYQETDANIVYTGNWTTWNDARASGGSTRYSNDPAASATLTFSGRQVSLLFTRYTSRGNIEITIDSGTPVLVNQYGAALSFQNRWDSPLMDAGTHTIVLRHPGGTKYIDLDALIVSSPESDPPAVVSLNAATGSNTGEVDLDWIAPGDDGDTGTATEYILRYASSAIDTQAAWDAAADVSGEPAPQVAGSAETLTVSGLAPGQTYYFALRTLDDSGNLSDLSNSPSAEVKAPTPVEPGIYQENDANIVTTGNWTNWTTASASGGSTWYSNDTNASASFTFNGRQVSLLFTRFTSRGNIEITIDGGTPVLLNQYGSTLTFQNRWDSPLMEDGTHTIVLRHPGGTKYIDLDALIVSSPESDPPAAVTLNAVTGSGTGEVDLNWIAPGDDGNTGTAVEYILRYAASAIDSQAAWDAAADITGEPAPQIAGSAETLTISGLVPGQTMYFALRTLDDSGNLSDLSNSPSAAAKAPTPVEPGTYQENDANIVTTGNWTNWTTASASGGSTWYSNDPAASASLTFSGRQVSLLFTRYTSRGNIEITIDGGTPVLLNQYGAALSFQNRWDSPLMADGTHTIVLRHPGGSKYIDLDALIVSSPESDPPSAVTLNAVTGSSTGEVDLSWIAPGDDGDTGTATEYIVRYASSAIDTQAAWDAAADVSGEPAPQVAGTAETLTISGLTPGQTYFFALRTLDDSGNLSGLSNSPSAEAKAPTPVGEGVYQENDDNIVYMGDWTSWSHASASGGAIRYTNQPGASATLTFTGRQVSLIFTRYTSRGNIEIIIDGGTPVLLNQYGAALSFQNHWDSPALDAGTHTIVLRHPGGTKYIDIDAIEVRAEP